LTDGEIPAKWERKRLLVGCAGQGKKGKLQQTHTVPASDAAVMILFLAPTLFHHQLQWGCVTWVVRTNWNYAVPYLYKSSTGGGQIPGGRKLIEKSNSRKIGHCTVPQKKIREERSEGPVHTVKLQLNEREKEKRI